ncbi:hypothetical protein HK100_000918 [Physocladia obscura]|uniref:Heterokaryon incompatibility domain-containing protein n=1 Tax=Physocladia obscura TaxID=109957 RepID=A0AAD5T058_9FUNG|nr:hypothetical protein HK100_000918 [Physocladia obscura]
MKIALTKIRRALTPQPPSERMRPSTAEPARAVAPAIDQHDGIYNLYDEIHKLELKKVEKALLCDDFEAKLNREPKNSPDRNLFSEMWIRHNDDLKEIKSQLAALNAQKLGPLYPKDEQLGTTNITTISFLCLKCVSNPSQTVVESFNQMRSCIHTLLNVPMEPEVVYAESVKNDLAALKLHSHNLIPHELISIISVAPELFFLNRINVFESMDSGLQALFRKVCEEAKVDLVSLQAAEHQLGEILETKLLNYPFPDPWSLFLQDGAPVIMSPPKGVTASHFSSGTAQPIGFLNKAMNTALKTAFGSAGLQSGFRPDRLFDCSTRSVVLTSSFQIQTAVEYFCVSHVWGTTQDLLAADFGISAITWKIPISSSGKLNDILMLMKTSGIQYWWMDILCIDQDNISDKNAQVSVMGNIYANGSGTMVYETSLDPENFDAFRVVYNFCMKLKMFSSMQPNNLVWRPNELILHIGTAIQQESLALLAGLLNASDWETRV